MSLVRKFATVGSGTMLSRVFGFAREMMMAAALGTGPVAEAFYAAFQFPNTFRRLFAEGAFNAAFVPLFAKEIEAGGVAGARKFSEEVFGVLFSVLLLLTIAMELAMPLVIRYAIAPGFADDPGKLLLTTELAAIMFPYLMCMSLGAMMAGMLNSLHRYFAAAIAPVFLNIILVGILVAAWYRGHDGPGVGWMLAWGVMLAGVVQLAILFFAVRRAGVSIGFRRPRLTRNVRRLLWLALPAAITGGITQINTLVGTAIATGRAGAVPTLNLADRVYQLPLGVVGVAVGVVLLPELARALRAGNRVEAANLQNRSVEFTLFLTLPAAAALLTIAEPIVRVLYERGAFTPQDTALVAEVLSVFGIALPAFVLIKAFTPGFFAREDTRTPMYFAGVSVLVNISLALALFPAHGAVGIAIAAATAGWMNAGLLFTTLVWRGHWARDAALLKRLPRLVLASAVMAGALYLSAGRMAGWLAAASPIGAQAGALALLVFGGMAIYFAIAFGTGGADLGMIRRNVRRRGAERAAGSPPDGGPE